MVNIYIFIYTYIYIYIYIYIYQRCICIYLYPCIYIYPSIYVLAEAAAPAFSSVTTYQFNGLTAAPRNRQFIPHYQVTMQ
jgi:hypothetical protein